MQYGFTINVQDVNNNVEVEVNVVFESEAKSAK